MNRISNSVLDSLKKASSSILLALLGVGAIYLIATDGSTRKPVVPAKTPVSVPAVAAAPTTDSQSTPAGGPGRIGVTSTPSGSDANAGVQRVVAVNNNAAAAQTPAPVLSPSPEPSVERKAFAMDSEFLQRPQPDLGRTNPVKTPGEVERKSLEKKRAAAERKRARLEELYQKHLISSEVYKKGEEKYKSEIEKYRSAVNGGRAPKSQIPAV
jgi:hypothetical protein